MQHELPIEKLIIKYLREDELTADEKKLLDNWINQSLKHKNLFERLCNEDALNSDLLELGRIDKEEVKKVVYEKLYPGIKLVGKVRDKGWQKYVAAASVFLLLSTGAYFWFIQDKQNQTAKTETNQSRFGGDAEPGKFKARLTLADGSTIVLDSAGTGKLAQQGSAEILNKSGQVIYNAEFTTSQEVLYNTLSTAKGEIYSLVLADGSKVWLNSASSIHFPVFFTGRERIVEITGEAYFEVTHNATKPFKVLVNDAEVQVLGTRFNINAYSDEAAIKTTLLEGSVKVSSLITHHSSLIKPGQQVQLSGENLKVINDADMEEVLAWKNGYFQFNRDDLETVMRQIARWYDVEVEYEGTIPQRYFGGKIHRNTNASQVLTILEKSRVHFRIEGKKIIVMP